tara:strand:+ start:428 stop:559 length:132 start_codon:yes stop_codon:yes gene_type:complete
MVVLEVNFHPIKILQVAVEQEQQEEMHLLQVHQVQVEQVLHLV